jgi:Cu/Ag efflux pump CusA
MLNIKPNFLLEYEGEQFDDKMIIRGSLERLVPVLMTALVAALALVPLAMDAQAPGKEILHPVAVVILGGLVSSTFLDIIVTPVGDGKIFKSAGEGVKPFKRF